MDSDWLIRRAQPADATAIARLADALSAHENEPTGRFTAQVILRDCLGDKPELAIWIAQGDGGPVGFATVHPTYDSARAQRGYYLADLYFEPDWRRQGVARALMAAVVAAARQDGRHFVWWTSHMANETAHRFYRSTGATDEPLVTHWLAIDAFSAAKSGK